MLEYARWKYYLVGAVLLLALLIALPTVFGEDFALQVALKNLNAMPSSTSTMLEQFLKDRGVTYTEAYLDNGRLMVRFASSVEQLKARDAMNDKYQDQFLTAL